MGEIVDPLAFRKKLTDSVFEFYKPKTVHLEVVFIHGLEQGKCGDAYWKTWARDGLPENLWPRTWLPKDFPSARVLALSYDVNTKRTVTDGRMDLFLLGENLIQEMVDFGRIGQNGVPVVFVCHGFGGLVAKQIVISGNKPQFSQNQKVKNLLQNIDAFCFYSTPHRGSHLAKSSLYLSGGAKSPLNMEHFEVLDKETGWLNQVFEQFKRPSWHFHVVAESHEISKFREMVVPEASSRYENATHMTLNASYMDICKPRSKKDSSYQYLTMCLKEVLDRNVVSLPLPVESEQEKSVKGMLQESRIVGLIGMGGSGKTTLAKVVYKSIYSDFERSSYLDDVKSKGTLDEVLVTLLRQFGIKNGKTGGEAQLSDFQDSKERYLKDLKAFVKEHKVLVVVDDVGSEDNFNHLLACTDFINGREDSRMIVTCRDWQLLRKHAPLVRKYEMKLLNGSGLDIELFSHHVYRGAKTGLQRREFLQEYLSRDASGTLIGDFESVFKDIVDACAGLPLSLEVMGSCIGSYLMDCDVSSRECLELWRGELQRFRDAEALDGVAAGNERLWKSVRISYDDLGPTLREKFLDVACFFCGSLRYDYRSLLRIWGGKPSDIMDLKNLEDKCLLKVNKDGVVTMHDQLRDMGRSIVQGDQRSPEYMTRVWTDKDVRKVLLRNGSTATVGLALGDWNKASEAIMSGKAHKTSERTKIMIQIPCPNLRLFDLREVQGEVCTNIVLEGSSSVQWICLRKGNITEVPNFIWNCIHLHVLDLHGCRQLKELSDFVGNLVKLLELNLRDCQNLESLPNSIGDLVNLSSLDIGGCWSLICLPESIGNLINLSSLYLHECGKLTCLPESIGNLVNLSSLDLRWCGSLICLPQSIGKLVNLSSLGLGECWALTSIPNSIGDLVNLSSLDFGGCWSLTCLPEAIGNLVNLSSLDLRWCISLIRLPQSIGKLVNLSSLGLRSCLNLTCLPKSIGNLVSLSSLDLHGCRQLTCLPESIGHLVNLSSLGLGGCSSLTCLPETIDNLINLSSLDLDVCGQLKCEGDDVCGQLKCEGDELGEASALSGRDMEMSGRDMEMSGRDMEMSGRVGDAEVEGGWRPWSGSKHFYNFLVMFFILLEPLSNTVGFLTNYGCFVFSLLLQWVRIPTGTSGQQVSSRYKSRVKSKDLTLGSFLGQGCSGMLYETTWSRSQENTGRLARKLFPGVNLGDVFESEVVRLSELTDHPNIVKIFCWTVDNRSCSLIMEFVSDNLSNIMRMKTSEARSKEAGTSKQIVIGTTRPGPFHFPEAIQIVAQIAKGIRHLHGQGIYHGDLKPNNVLIDKEMGPMSVKLADFGLFKTKRRTTLVSQRTLCSQMIAWSAPEIVKDYICSMSDDLDYLGVELDIQDTSSVLHAKLRTKISMEKADTYSFALLCAYVLGGKVWDANLSSNELRKQTSRFNLRPKLPSECPKALAYLISLCWHADPKRRPAFSYICDKLEEIVKVHQQEKKGMYPLEQPEEETVRQRARPVGGKYDA